LLNTNAPTTTVSCNICGSADYSIVYGPGLAQVNQVVKCSRCGLMYANPRIDADHVRIETWDEDPNWDFELANPLRFEKERLQTRDYANTRALLNRLCPQRGLLIEVGSSSGSLLETFRNDGWRVLGVEPDRNAARYAKAKFGVETTNTILERAGIPDHSADVVVMLHVIEHVPDPVGTLTEIHRVLKPGGYLIVETPRYDTLMFKLFGRRERSISCDGHIYFFTTDTLRKTYEKAGFVLEKFEYVGRSLTLDRLVYNIGVMIKAPAIARVIQSLSRSLRFNKINFTINVRDMQRVCIRKPL